MPDLARRSLAEAIATFFLVFIGVCAIAADASTTDPLAGGPPVGGGGTLRL